MLRLQLSDWANIAEVVTAIAVVGSLVYVGIEVHRNTATQVQISTQALVSEASSAYELIASDPDLACIYLQGIAGFESLNSHEKLRLSAFMMHSLRSLEDLYIQWLEGLVDQRIWSGFDAQITEVSQAPGLVQWWKLRRHFFSDVFQDYFGKKMAAANRADPPSAMGPPECSK